VAIAKDVKYSVKVVTDEELKQLGQLSQAVQPTMPGQPNRPLYTNSSHTSHRNNSQSTESNNGTRASQSSMGAPTWPREKCTLCSSLGLGLDGHSRSSCFIDPESKVFKPEVRTRRLQSCLDRGLKIPQWILDQGHFQPKSTTTGKGVSFVTEDEARDMVAALQGAK
jgi:hypothetical protein